ncbi:hypothetical protein ACNTMW_05245 [Planosporangium sp. 12N6]|uniref:hypothetical protein n=1 Tax=Planosporangium spinosum TaxID=3402278 RepID=UPI003CF4481D
MAERAPVCHVLQCRGEAGSPQIAENIAEAAAGSPQIAENIVGVAAVAKATTESVMEAQWAADEVPEVSGQPRSLVSGFRF